METFKGYVRTIGKKCVDKYGKGAKLRTLEQARVLDEYAGVLADDIVLIDIDDSVQAEILMCIVEDAQIDCKVVQTTRGRHFFFKNPPDGGVEKCGTNKRLACGLVADIKVGRANSYAVAKVEGKERFCEWDTEGEFQALPKFLYPLASSVDFRNMDEGDGRNNALFGHILTMQGEGFSVEECRETVQVINDYILDEPLPADEIEKITRDDAFKVDLFVTKGKFNHDTFAKFLMSRYHIVKLEGRLHVYSKGIYCEQVETIESAMIRCIPTLKRAQRAEVLDYMRIEAPSAKTTDNANIIAFENGLLDLSTGTMREFDPSVIITNKIPHKYNPSATCEVVDRTLDKMACNDEQIRALLEECAGYCLYRRNELRKAFILTGGKSNGKSTFLTMIEAMLGKENVTNLDIGELGQRFSTSSLFRKLANIGDDISDEFMNGNAVANFKKVASGSPIKAEFKGQPVFEFRPYAKLLYSANDIPRMRDKTGAVLTRLIIIPFEATFSRSDPDFDAYIIDKLTSEAACEYLLALGVKGLQRVIERQAFTESQKVTANLREYELENNPITLFVEETGIDGIIHETTTDVYRRYTLFCAENNFTTMSNIVFSKTINKRCELQTKLKKLNGKPVRVFERI